MKNKCTFQLIDISIEWFLPSPSKKSKMYLRNYYVTVNNLSSILSSCYWDFPHCKFILFATSKNFLKSQISHSIPVFHQNNQWNLYFSLIWVFILKVKNASLCFSIELCIKGLNKCNVDIQSVVFIKIATLEYISIFSVWLSMQLTL